MHFELLNRFQPIIFVRKNWFYLWLPHCQRVSLFALTPTDSQCRWSVGWMHRCCKCCRAWNGYRLGRSKCSDHQRTQWCATSLRSMECLSRQPNMLYRRVMIPRIYRLKNRPQYQREFVLYTQNEGSQILTWHCLCFVGITNSSRFFERFLKWTHFGLVHAKLKLCISFDVMECVDLTATATMSGISFLWFSTIETLSTCSCIFCTCAFFWTCVSRSSLVTPICSYNRWLYSS